MREPGGAKGEPKVRGTKTEPTGRNGAKHELCGGLTGKNSTVHVEQ